MAICKAPLTKGYTEAHSAWQVVENKSSTYEETQIISPLASHSGVHAGGVSFQSEGPTTAKGRFWYREVRDNGRAVRRRHCVGGAPINFGRRLRRAAGPKKSAAEKCFFLNIPENI